MFAMRATRLTPAGDLRPSLGARELSVRTGLRGARRKALVRMERFDPAAAGSWLGGYRFGEFRLEADGTLLHEESPVSLDAHELAALRLLLANHGQVVTLQQLEQVLGAGDPVTADVVTKCLASLRRRLEPEDCIQAVPRRGYRFSAEVHPISFESVPSIPRLAILPFTASYGVPEYLGAALAEDAGTHLAAAHPSVAHVLSRESVVALARRGLSARQVGEKMKADLVLSGELRAMASHYRLRAEVIRVESGSPLWTEDLLVERARIIELGQDLSNRVLRRLSGLETAGLETARPEKAKLESARPHPARSDTAISLSAAADSAPEPTHQQREAFELFLRGRYESQSLERHRMQDAVQHLLHAIELDPGQMQARVQLANLCVAQVFCGFVQPLVAAEMMRRIAGTVADLPYRAERMLPALGWISFHADRNMPAAMRLFARSSHLPHEPGVTRARSMFALSRRHFDEAIEMLRAALHADPFSAWAMARLAWAYHLAGESAASLQAAHAAMERFPEHEAAELYGAMILAFNGETARAVQLAASLAQRVPYLDPAAAVHAYALAMAGRRDEARVILDRLQWLCRERYAMNTFTPAAYVALGELDTALAELHAANGLRCPWFFQMLADPRLKPLRTRPDFETMLGILAGMETEAAREPIEE
jgi:DNA-binding winged helix-turn-helix (wHTH) protein/tetratricopeptide (TPR) repeat protein